MSTRSEREWFFSIMKTREDRGTNYELLPLPFGKFSLTSHLANVKLSDNPYLTITHITVNICVILDSTWR